MRLKKQLEIENERDLYHCGGFGPSDNWHWPLCELPGAQRARVVRFLDRNRKAHIYEILPKLRHLNQGDIIEGKDFVLVVSFVKASQRAEPLVSVYSNLHGSHDVRFTKRAVSEVKRIVHQGEPDYPALAAKFLQQQ